MRIHLCSSDQLRFSKGFNSLIVALLHYSPIHFYFLQRDFEYNPGSTPCSAQPPTPSATANRLVLEMNDDYIEYNYQEIITFWM